MEKEKRKSLVRLDSASSARSLKVFHSLRWSSGSAGSSGSVSSCSVVFWSLLWFWLVLQVFGVLGEALSV